MTPLERKCRKLVREWRSDRYWVKYAFRCAEDLEAILPKKRKRKAKK